MVHLTILSELTIDGKLSLGPDASSKGLFEFYGDELRAWFHAQRAASDAIMVGAGTVRADDPELTVRFAPGRNPLRVIPCSSGRLPPESRLLNDGHPTLVAVSARALPADLETFGGKSNVETVVCGRDQVDLAGLVDLLAARGVERLVVEGGSSVLHSLFAADLVDRIIVKHIPVIAGAPLAPSFLHARADAAPLALSRWRLADCFVKSGVAVTIYEKPTGDT